MNFISLTVLDYFGAGGEDVYQAETAMTYINVERILWFAAAERGTQVWMEGGEEFLVRETVSDIIGELAAYNSLAERYEAGDI